MNYSLVGENSEYFNITSFFKKENEPQNQDINETIS